MPDAPFGRPAPDWAGGLEDRVSSALIRTLRRRPDPAPMSRRRRRPTSGHVLDATRLLRPRDVAGRRTTVSRRSSMTRSLRAPALLLVAALVAACGGGGGSAAPASEAPASAPASAGSEAPGSPAAGGEINVLSLWGGSEEEAFKKVL